MYSAEVRKKSIGKMRSTRLLIVLLAPVVVFILGAAAPNALAGGSGWRVPFADKAIFFEYNSTDQDLGLHIFFDAEAWTEVEVIGRDGEEIFETENDGSLSDLGSTEVSTESAEPPLCDEEDPEDCSDEEIEEAIAAFKAQFPEGWYRFRGRTIEGKRLRGRAFLSHALPGAPIIISPAEYESVDPDEPFIIEWSSEDGDAETVRYEIVVEFEDENERVYKFVVQVPAIPGAESQTMTVPEEFFESFAEIDGEYKVEVLGIAETRNATITELEFEFAD